jgi:hypothetical protein
MRTTDTMKDVRIIAAAEAQQAAEGRVTYTRLVEATGITYHALGKRTRRLRKEGRFPWWITKEFASKPVVPRAGREAPAAANDERFLADDDIRKRVLAEGLAAMGDGRAEIDDPREHGLLAVPRSVARERASEDLAEECRKYVREWKGVRRRQRWGSTRRAVA